MNMRPRHSLPVLATIVAGACLAVSERAAAAEYWLQAEETAKSVATATGSESITMWEYARCEANFANCVASAPGPLLRVAAGDPSLVVHVRNGLSRNGAAIALTHVAAYGGAAVPVSLQIPGLANAGFSTGVTTSCASATSPVDVDGRIRSFTSEVANAADGTYCWSTRPGTFVYQSGTHPAVQVQMGLYGAVIVDGAGCTGTKCAYSSVPYDREVLAVYSEIDPSLHAAVADDSYGDAGAATPKTSTIVYAPQYFFVDGEAEGSAFNSLASVAAGLHGDRILIRLANAGIESHVPVLQGSHMSLVAEDGNPYDASLLGHMQYSTLLAAGKTVDAVFTPAVDGTYSLFDRRRITAHAAPGATGAAASGMLVKLVVGPAANLPGTTPDAYTVLEDTTLTVPARGVLENDPTAAAPDSGYTASRVAGSGPSHGAITAFGSNGSFTYVPSANYNGIDTFQYTASNGSSNSAATLVTVTVQPVNDAPVAVNDTYNALTAQATVLDVVANDTDIDLDALRPVLDTAPANGTVSIDGTTGVLTYTSNAGFEGPDTFTYFANDGTANSAAPATVTVNVSANSAPMAVNDSATMAEDSGSTAVAVLANDSDPNGDPINVTTFTQPTGGAVVRDAADANVLVFTPNLNYNGTATFSYTITDTPGVGSAKSASANVSVLVTPVNDPPVAVNDAFTITDDAANTVAAPGVLANDSDVDGDPLQAVLVSQPSNATVVLNLNGGFTITPGAGFNGVATFTYQARDPSGALSNTATTVTVTIPVAIAGGGIAFNAAANRFVANGTSTLPPGTTLRFFLVPPTGGNGTFFVQRSVLANRTWTFNIANPLAITPVAGSTVRVVASTGYTLINIPLIIQ